MKRRRFLGTLLAAVAAPKAALVAPIPRLEDVAIEITGPATLTLPASPHNFGYTYVCTAVGFGTLYVEGDNGDGVFREVATDD